MIGFLLYVFTMAYVPHYFMVIVGVFLLFYNQSYFISLYKNNDFTFLFIFFFIFICTVNILFHANQGVKLPYVVLNLVTLAIAYSLKLKDIRVFVYLVVFEVIIGFFELSLGVSTILPVAEKKYFLEGSMWYNTRVTGLTLSEASYAMKIFIGLVLFERFKNIFKYQHTIRCALLLGVFLSFHRTSIVAAIILEGLFIFSFILNKINMSEKWKVKRNNLYLSVMIIVLIIFLIILSLNNIQYLYNMLVFQFTRGSGGVELSGRSEIWTFFLLFISDNFIFGNGSVKLYAEGGMHAHNSFLQLLANNGIVLSFLYIAWLGININKNNFIYVISILIFSTAQYGVFWGTSVMDITLFLLLFTPLGNSNVNASNKTIYY